MPSPLPALLLGLQLLAGPDPDPGEIDLLVGKIFKGYRPEVDKAVARLVYLGKPRAAVKQLVDAARDDLSTPVGNSAADALALLQVPEAGPVFIARLESPEGLARMTSCRGLGRLPVSPAGLTAVGKHVADANLGTRRECAKTLGIWGPGAQVAALGHQLAVEEDGEAATRMAEALGRGKPDAAGQKALEKALTRPDLALKNAAASALAQANVASGKSHLESLAKSGDAHLRKDATEAVGRVQTPWATQFLADRLTDADGSVVLAAGLALEARKDPRGLSGIALKAEGTQGADRALLEGALRERNITEAQRLDLIARARKAK